MLSRCVPRPSGSRTARLPRNVASRLAAHLLARPETQSFEPEEPVSGFVIEEVEETVEFFVGGTAEEGARETGDEGSARAAGAGAGDAAVGAVQPSNQRPPTREPEIWDVESAPVGEPTDEAEIEPDDLAPPAAESRESAEERTGRPRRRRRRRGGRRDGEPREPAPARGDEPRPDRTLEGADDDDDFDTRCAALATRRSTAISTMTMGT